MNRIFTCIMLATVVTGFAGCQKEEPTKAKETSAVATVSSPVTVQGASEYNFEDGSIGWKALDKVQITQSTDKPHSGKASLKIAGTAKAGLWSFATSGKVGVTPGKRYKFSGWMFVESINKNTSSFKCELWQEKQWLKNVDVKKYDLKNIGQWQETSVVFTVPEGNNLSLSIAVEKRPQDQAVEGTIYIDDLKLEKLD